MSRQRRSLSRRRFLASAAAVPLAVVVGSQPAIARGTVPSRGTTQALPALPGAAIGPGDPTHLAWVWQFRHDGDQAQIRVVLAAHNLGIAMKTHDGTDWMSRYDDSADAIDGPEAVASLVRYFEDGGVPFHAWSVLNGEDPTTEAALASQVIDAGVRSLIVDLEAHAGFWRGTDADAEVFGAELRRRQPNAFVATSIDARPWEVPRIPMAEFAQFTNAIAPQVYWGTFNNIGNIAKYTLAGEVPGPDGITPRFALQSALRAVEEFGLPVHPIGDGTVDDGGEWSEFIDEAFLGRSQALSVWRFGVADDTVWELLRDSPPRTPTYTIEAGDTLSGLAAEWGTSVDAIVETNGIADPNFLYIGQELRIPGAGVAFTPTNGEPSGGSTSAPAPAPLGTQNYVVQPGDSLWSIAIAFDTTVDELAAANGIVDQGYIRIGDTLVLP